MMVLVQATRGRGKARSSTKSRSGASRRTFGHSLVVAPWGEILADAGTDPGVVCVDLDMEKVAEARKRVPALTHDREFNGP